MSAPKKFKSALKKLCDRAKSALNSQARISSPGVFFVTSLQGLHVYIVSGLKGPIPSILVVHFTSKIKSL